MGNIRIRGEVETNSIGFSKTRKGGGHTPNVTPDNLFSHQKLSIIDLLCEGQIVGIEGGLQGVLLGDTPVMASGGSYNFSNLSYFLNEGTQSQQPIPNFSSSQIERSVGLEVKNDTPIIQTIINDTTDRVRVTVGVYALFYNASNGDVNGSKAQLAVEVFEGSRWNLRQTVTIEGKTSSQYLRSIMLENLPAAPFEIRVRRITGDATDGRTNNKTLWSSLTEISDSKLSYPNSALIGMCFDSEQFSGVPTRKYLVKGMIIQVPNNYDPDTRAYSGLWTGTFKSAWSDNPAWILYDLVTNKRYGLGKRLGDFGMDKFALYKVAQYCDGLVDDGYGGKEPRFTCSCYLTEQRQAYDVIQDFCSIFRAMPVWTGSELSVIMDGKEDMSAIYTNANVVEGKFTYSSSAQKDRHTVAHVRYVDKYNSYGNATEYVADDDLIKRFGVNVIQIDAFGCTTRSQAHRVGKWILTTERLETQSVSFSVGREGLKHFPGDIIGIADNDYAGAKIGGRMIKVSGNQVMLDREVQIKGNSTFTYTDLSANLKSVAVSSQKDSKTLILESAIEADRYSVWMLKTEQIEHRLFKALTITENDDGSFGVTAVQYSDQKEAIVDESASFEGDQPNFSISNNPAPTYFQADVLGENEEYQVRLSWMPPNMIGITKYEVTIYQNEALIFIESVTSAECYAKDLGSGDFSAKVRAFTNQNKTSEHANVDFTLTAVEAPSDLDLTLNEAETQITIQPLFNEQISTTKQCDFYKGRSKAEVESKEHYLGRGLSAVDNIELAYETEYWYGANTVTSKGESALTTQMIQFEIKEPVPEE